MTHYDDLQLFKNKTNNQSLNLKNLVEQQSYQEKSDWPILNQICSDKTLDDTLVYPDPLLATTPESAAEHTFSPAAKPEPSSPTASSSPLLNSLNTLLTPSPGGNTITPADTATSATADNKKFAHLFTLHKNNDPELNTNNSKNISLKLLLEKISACR